MKPQSLPPGQPLFAKATKAGGERIPYKRGSKTEMKWFLQAAHVSLCGSKSPLPPPPAACHLTF